MKKQKSPPCKSRLGNLILVDKKRLATELSDFQAGVKSKEEVEDCGVKWLNMMDGQ